MKWRDAEGSGHCLDEVTILECPWKDWGNPRTPSVRTDCVSAGTQTWHLPNTRKKHYRLSWPALSRDMTWGFQVRCQLQFWRPHEEQNPAIAWSNFQSGRVKEVGNWEEGFVLVGDKGHFNVLLLGSNFRWFLSGPFYFVLCIFTFRHFVSRLCCAFFVLICFFFPPSPRVWDALWSLPAETRNNFIKTWRTRFEMNRWSAICIILIVFRSYFVNMKWPWDITVRICYIYWRFGGKYCLHPQSQLVSQTASWQKSYSRYEQTKSCSSQIPAASRIYMASLRTPEVGAILIHVIYVSEFVCGQSV